MKSGPEQTSLEENRVWEWGGSCTPLLPSVYSSFPLSLSPSFTPHSFHPFPPSLSISSFFLPHHFFIILSSISLNHSFSPFFCATLPPSTDPHLSFYSPLLLSIHSGCNEDEGERKKDHPPPTQLHPQMEGAREQRGWAGIDMLMRKRRRRRDVVVVVFSNFLFALSQGRGGGGWRRGGWRRAGF